MGGDLIEVDACEVCEGNDSMLAWLWISTPSIGRPRCLSLACNWRESVARCLPCSLSRSLGQSVSAYGLAGAVGVGEAGGQRIGAGPARGRAARCIGEKIASGREVLVGDALP